MRMKKYVNPPKEQAANIKDDDMSANLHNTKIMLVGDIIDLKSLINFCLYIFICF